MSLCSSSTQRKAVFLVPTILRIGRYVVYFWSNENNPREFIHVHISVKNPSPNSTKLWITSDGKVLVCNNNSKIPEYGLWRLIEDIERDSDVVIRAWRKRFGEIHYIR